MKFRYLGTAAAEGWPAVFCNCDNCMRAKKAGGRNLRTRSQAIMNDDLLIDLPADTFAHALDNRLDLSACRYLLVTHSHLDHFQPQDLFMRFEGCYSHALTEETMTMIGSKDVLNVWKRYQELYKEDPVKSVDTQAIGLYETMKFGRYTITALPANHMPSEEAHVYAIDDGTAKILYLHDTGILEDGVFEHLSTMGFRADFVSFDCTFVTLPGSGGHLGLDTCIQTRDALAGKGIIDKSTILCINHFSHNGGPIYDELVPIAEKDGFLTAYDGMEINI